MARHSSPSGRHALENRAPAHRRTAADTGGHRAAAVPIALRRGSAVTLAGSALSLAGASAAAWAATTHLPPLLDVMMKSDAAPAAHTVTLAALGAPAAVAAPADAPDAVDPDAVAAAIIRAQAPQAAADPAPAAAPAAAAAPSSAPAAADPGVSNDSGNGGTNQGGSAGDNGSEPRAAASNDSDSDADNSAGAGSGTDNDDSARNGTANENVADNDDEAGNDGGSGNNGVADGDSSADDDGGSGTGSDDAGSDDGSGDGSDNGSDAGSDPAPATDSDAGSDSGTSTDTGTSSDNDGDGSDTSDTSGTTTGAAIALGTATAARTLAGSGRSASGNLPSDLIDSKDWYLTLPTGKKGSPDTVEGSALAGYHSRFFQLNPAKNGVVFTAGTGGATTSGSQYPRSELREMTGSKKASWDGRKGRHTMEIVQAITETPKNKPDVIAGQIHATSDDLMQIHLSGTKLRVKYDDGKKFVDLDPNYRLGTMFAVKIESAGGRVKVWYNGQLRADLPISSSTSYFKAGVYTNSNPSRGDKAGEGQVVIRSLDIRHT